MVLFGVFTILLFSSWSMAEDSKGALSLSLENDAFVVKTDRHYTNGLELSYISDSYMPRWFDWAISWLPFHAKGDDARFSWSLGQKMYTPADIEAETLTLNDRPYAGWLFTSLGLIAEQDYTRSRHVESLEIILGVVGPKSGADNMQKVLHDYLDATEPQGWDHQLHNEYTADLRYRRTWLVPILSDKIDVLPSVGFTAGTSQRLASAGFGIRIGNHVNADYGPPLIRPSLSGTHYFQPGQGLYWYLFTAVRGRYVDYNIFLDGNRDGNSHSVDKEDWIGDIQAGIVIGRGDWRLTITNVKRSREFVLQETPDKFGSITFTHRF